MCGRYTQRMTFERLARRYGIRESWGEFQPSFNIAPGQSAPVVVNEEKKVLKTMLWGLVPFWAKEADKSYKTINARSETLTEKPTFRKPFERRRCLVPADGFYEWTPTGSGRSKAPFFFAVKDQEVFSFAGLWDRWESSEGPALETYAIITVGANELVKTYHPRMPAILKPEDEGKWLDPELRDTARLTRFLKPYAAGKMKAHPVSTLVNSPANNNPLCVEPQRAR